MFASPLSVRHDGRRGELETELSAAADPGIVELHPNFPELYSLRIAELEKAIARDGPDRAQAVAILRGLIDRIVINPLPGRGPVRS